MKKKIWIPIAGVVVLLAILFVPIPQGSYDDGGTREWVALTYKIVDWNRISTDGVYEKTRIYGPADKNKSIDELWKLEQEQIGVHMTATVVYIDENTVLLESVEDGQRYRIQRKGPEAIHNSQQTELEDIGVKEGSVVDVHYSGALLYSDPPTIASVKSWKLSKNLRHLEYTEQWIDKTTAEKYDHNIFGHIAITEISSDCFFAQTVIPMPYTIKLNGTLSDEWCVGDQVLCTYENTYYDEVNQRVEVDFLTIEPSDWAPDPNADYKPVIYLYPTEKTEVTVKLDYSGHLTCTYPAYNDGWTVTASPDGILSDANGQTYNYLYWEGETYTQYDMTKGFCVKGEDTAAFLEDALAKLGLNRREANEFIVFWLPLMQENPYNIISFQTDVYTESAKLTVTPTPDTVIRVFMAYKSADNYVEIEAQELTAPAREGFTVIEWGGTEVK